MKSAASKRRFHMRRRFWVLLTVFVALWHVFWTFNKPEPFYSQQPLSYWMARMADPATAAEASSVLREMGPEAVPALVDALNTRSTVLSEFGHRAAVKLKLAAEQPYDSPNIRATAAYLLGQMRSEAAAAVPDLIIALQDDDAVVRVKTIRALSQIGEIAVPELTAALRHEDPLVRFGAAKALGAIGPQAKRAASALTNCLNDPHANVREAATHALTALRK